MILIENSTTSQKWKLSWYWSFYQCRFDCVCALCICYRNGDC